MFRLVLILAVSLGAPRFPGASNLPTGPTSPFAQESPAVDNLRAFAKLYGYVRYFHPSDEAAALDWEAFAAHGAIQVKDASSPEELRSILEDLFLPFAPTLQIYSANDRPPPVPPELSPGDSADLEVVAWQHLGVGFGSVSSIYKSIRLNRESRLTIGETTALLTQRIDLSGMAGKEVRFTGMGIAVDDGARVHLWLRVDRPGGARGFFDNMMDRPVTSSDWTPMVIQGPVAEDASAVYLGGILQNGRTALDHLRLEVREGDQWIPAPVPIENGDFEAGVAGGEGGVDGWVTPTPGWDYARREGDASLDAYHGEHFLLIAPGTTGFSGPLFPQAPSVGEVVEKPLGRGLMARVPLALYSRDGHTLGDPNPLYAAALAAPLQAINLPAMTATDEALRLADVTMAWNIFQHFYPYYDVVDTHWDVALTTALTRALSDQSKEEFLSTLRWMAAQLQDGHGFVSGPTDPQGGLHIAVAWIEGQVVVVATAAPTPFRVGDVIQRIDGRPATEVLNETAETFSGSPQWRRWRAQSQFGFGPLGSEAELDLLRGSETLTVDQVRASAQAPTEPRPQNIEELEPGIFYVNLDLVEVAAFRERVDELAAADGVVFDLRGYPNGNHLALTYLTDQNLNSAFWKVPQIIYPDHDGEAHFADSRWDLPPSQPRFQGKIVFLTDGRAISYAESVMGIVEHYRLGEIVGQPTAGANGNVNPFTLPGNYRFSWTGMRVIKHDGSQHHTVGIQPTVPTTRTIQGVREGRDELLDRALELIRGG